jgi:hypothetical protein
MPGILDLFSEDDPSFTAQIWRYGDTGGVVMLGPSYPSIPDAKAALGEHVGSPLTFSDSSVTPEDAYKKRLNLAVVLGEDTGSVVTCAPLPGSLKPRSG